jgi:hypothetical protein
MRNRALAVGVTAALLIWAAPAFAFEETKEAAPEVLQLAPEAKDPAMQLQTQTPATGTVQAPEKSVGAKIFGFSILPKLDFGLELLYSEPQAADLQQVTPPEDNEDLTVFGKVKRQF